jgi:hypothetical protein
VEVHRPGFAPGPGEGHGARLAEQPGPDDACWIDRDPILHDVREFTTGVPVDWRLFAVAA